MRGANGSPKTAGILSMPASQAAVRHRPLHWLGVDPGPPVSLAEEDDNKVCLPAKRQRSSTLGTGTGNAPFSTLQVKVRRQSAGTAHFDGQRSPCLRDYWQTRQWSHKSRFSKVRVSRLGIMSLFRRWCEVIRWRHGLNSDVGGENKKVVL